MTEDSSRVPASELPPVRFVFHYGVRRGPYREGGKFVDGPHPILEMRGDVLHTSEKVVVPWTHSSLCGLNATGHSACTCGRLGGNG